MDKSSPSVAPPSSPLFRVKKRKPNQTSRHFSTSARRSPSSRLPHPKLINNTRDDSLHISGRSEVSPLHSSPPSSCHNPFQPQIQLNHAPPMIQGIELVSSNELPDRLRSVFRYPLFNAIQSKCFPIAYKSSDNLVASAPTGSGKTAILEMAICHLVAKLQVDQFKIVYMAPTKSLCSERHRDWQTKFAPLNLECAELTGDTEQGQLRSVQSASIIITTPEKWDSMTRKWKDHARLMQMVKLLLIDEVHILRDTRGATLEAVISRMKSVGSDVRFVALSATVPNSEDVARWLGKNPNNQHIPASLEKFGEEFRPVKLQKHVIGIPYRGNDFGFETVCDPKLPDIIAKYSHKKPIMVFCMTRNSTISTAKLLANVWASKTPRDRFWEPPTQRFATGDPDLRNTLTSGVAFHHAGVDGADRHTIEKGFLDGQVSVICCTSTLAVGVNLPCHMVIIKNTMSWSDDGLKEYSDLEIMQMLGRAGRPQFDTSAVALIVTKQEKAAKYERLVSGEELLESCLHLHLIDHLNAEIGLGTIHNLQTAKRWLGGTFLFIRLGQNPDHYRLDGDAVDLNLDDRVERICKRDLALLENSELISFSEGRLKATELGDAMARYYVEFETMQVLLGLNPSAKMSDILSAVVQAREFHEVRLKSYEKKLFKEINGASGIKFPIKVDLAMPAHKRSLILQTELGGVEYPADEQFGKYKRQFNQEKNILFSHIHRLIHCVIDCQIYRQDAVAVRHALELARSFSAKAWDNSPYQMKQVPQIGIVAIRKLAVGGINSIEALEATEPHRIEMLLSKNPPFGHKLLDNLKEFPRLRVSLKLMGKVAGKGRPVTIKFKAECSFMNDKVPLTFHRKPLYICLLTERSDGQLVDFKRISAKNLNNGKDFLMSAELLNRMQYITCHVMCDAVAGTSRSAELKPDLPSHLFPQAQDQRQQVATSDGDSRRCKNGSTQITPDTSPGTIEDDEFDERGIGDQDMVDAIVGMEFRDIDQLGNGFHMQKPESKLQTSKKVRDDGTYWNPKRLENGRWACNHKCKDKKVCKHMCCREGVDKVPKPPKNAFVSAASLVDVSSVSERTGRNLHIQPITKRKPTEVETLDLAGESSTEHRHNKAPRGLKSLERLHNSVVKCPPPPMIAKKKPLYTSATQSHLVSQSNESTCESSDRPSTDYDGEWMVSLPSPSTLLGNHGTAEKPGQGQAGGDKEAGLMSAPALVSQEASATRSDWDTDSFEDFDPSRFNDDNEKSDIEAALVGLSDSVIMHDNSQNQSARIDTQEEETVLNELPTNRDNASKCEPKPMLNTFNSSSKLFLSTDSPEKQQTRFVEAETMEFPSSPPVLKKPRISSPMDTALQPSVNRDNETTRQGPTIKPGQPAWVYDFDPAFIAEFQDFVDFV
ncbi:ATP-dependent DNA helicase MER3 [Lecanora helva]